MLQRHTGLKPDATAQHGLFTLPAAAGEIRTVELPAWARIIRLINPTSDLSWRIDAPPAAPGSGTLADGGYAISGETTPILVPAGAATLQLRSAIASASVRVEVRS